MVWYYIKHIKDTVELKEEFYKAVEMVPLKGRLTTKNAIPLSPCILIAIKFVKNYILNESLEL